MRGNIHKCIHNSGYFVECAGNRVAVKGTCIDRICNQTVTPVPYLSNGSMSTHSKEEIVPETMAIECQPSLHT